MPKEEIRVQQTGEGVVVHLSGGLAKAATPFLIEECIKAISECASGDDCDFVQEGVVSQRCLTAATNCVR